MKACLPILAAFLATLMPASAAPDLDLYGGASQGEIFSGSTPPSTTNGTDFGDVNVDDGIKVRIFTIINNGTSNLNVTGFTNTAPVHYGIVALPTAPIPPGASDTFRIRFDPNTPTQHNAVIGLINNSSVDPFTFNITGRGITAPVIRVEGRSDNAEPYDEFFDGDITPESSQGTLFPATNLNTPVDHQFRVRNTGGATMNLIHSAISPHFQLLGLAGSLAPGTSDTFTIRFTPTATGELSANITIGTNASNTTAFNFTVQGFGNGPDLRISGGLMNTIFDGDTSPTTTDGTDFGTLHIDGGTQTNTFRAQNTGNQNLIISSATITGANASDFSLAGLDSFMMPSVFDDFTITFNPSSAGAKVAEVRIESNDPDESPYTFVIWGNGQGTPSIKLTGEGKEIDNGSTTPEAINGTLFAPTKFGQTLSRNFVITNSGTDTLTLSPPANGTHFSVSGVAASLAPGQSDTFTVNFSPTSPGDLSQTITIASNDPDDNPFTFVVQGTGLVPAFLIYGGPTQSGISIPNGDSTPRAADGTDFGIVLTAVDTVVHTFQIPNTGTAPLIISDVRLDGAHATNFSVGSFDPEVPVGSTREIDVTFHPTSNGLKTATLVVESNIAPYSFAIAGTGISVPDIRVQGGASTSSLADISNGSLTAETANGTLLPDASVGSSSITKIRVFNDGNASISINKSSSNSRFTMSEPANQTFANGTSVTFDLIFSPLEAGVQTATITITSNDPDENPYTFLVQGVGRAPEIALFGGTLLTVPIPDGDTSPTRAKGTGFGIINVNQSPVTRRFRIENTGNETLVFTDISISDPANFSVSIPIPPLPPMSTGEITITCHPVLPVNTKTATITLHSNDPDEGEYSFVVTAKTADTIDDPDLKVFGGDGFTVPVGSGSVLTQTANGTIFGFATVGTAPVTATFQIKNTGTANLVNVSTTSAHPDLNISGGNASTLGAGRTITFTASFNPTTIGLQTAYIQIASNDPNEDPYVFAVLLDVKAEVPPEEPVQPSILNLELEGTNGSVAFIGISGKTYILTTSTTMTGIWPQVPGTSPVVANGSVQSISFAVDLFGDPKRFYRLEEVP